MTDEAKKKIIIDEDWKSQVEAERQKETVTESQEQAGARAAGVSPPVASPEQPEADDYDGPLPPADLLFLASSLYMQALVALGLIANPITNKPDMNLPQAKHAIDMLQMLQEKTQGNRTEEESRGIEAMLHELRMAFVSVQTKA